MAEVYLESRLDFLHKAQNADGGWGYFPGKQSWLEPTAYAMLALDGAAGVGASLDRAFALVRSWQLPDGSYRPGAGVRDSSWVTALAVTLASLRGVRDDSVRRSVDYLLETSGAEASLAMRAASYFHLLKTSLDVSHTGWPWHPGNAAWIEPTAHTLIALKKVGGGYGGSRLVHRVREGETMILTRRCRDGGWNCGNPNVLSYDLPSYPETTALALLGLQGRRASELAGPLAAARAFLNGTKSSLAKAWLRIALAQHGQPAPAPPDAPFESSDVLLAALEALGHPHSNHALLRPGGSA